MINWQKFTQIHFLLIAAIGGISGCSEQVQNQASIKSVPAPIVKVVKNDSCPSISHEREQDLRKAVEAKRKLVDKILRSDIGMKGVKLSVTAHVDLECKILEAPGTFVNVTGDYVPYNNPKQRLIVDGLVKKHSDKKSQIYNNIGNRRSSK